MDLDIYSPCMPSWCEHQLRLALGLTLPPAPWVEGFFQGCNMAEAGFLGDILGAIVLWCVQRLFYHLDGPGFEL